MPQRDSQLSHFPAFMHVEGRSVAVFGNGDEAFAKARLLTNTRAVICAYGDAPEPDYAEFLAKNHIRHIAEPYDPAQLDGHVLIFAATADAVVDAGISADARSRRIPVNAVDQPDLCDFYTPALVNRAPVAVAIGTQGTGPVLAQMLRARIDQMLAPSLGPLARLAAGYRDTVDRLLPRGRLRRDFWRQFFSGSVERAIADGDEAGARRAAARLIGRTQAGDHGHIWLVGAGSGEPDLLTLRAQRALMEADVIVAGQDVPQVIVDMGRRDAARAGFNKPDDAVSHAVAEAGKGGRVVLLVAGGSVSDAPFDAALEVLKTASVPFDIVPGVSGTEIHTDNAAASVTEAA